ncbi:MAG: methyltransferase domain-containing protein [Pseudomonadota bacterium]
MERSRYEEHNNDIEDEKYLQYLRKTWEKVSSEMKGGELIVDYGCGPSKGLHAVLKGKDFQVVSYDPIFYPTSLDVLIGHVDVIYCSEAIEHMYDPRKEIEVWLRLLKSRGWITLRTAFHDGPNTFRDWWYKDDPTHIGFFNKITFETLALQFDLEIRHIHSPYVSFRKK